MRSISSRLEKLETRLSINDRQVKRKCNREIFEFWVERFLLIADKFSLQGITREHAVHDAYAWLMAKPGVIGFDFDLADVGLQIENDTLDSISESQ